MTSNKSRPLRRWAVVPSVMVALCATSMGSASAAPEHTPGTAGAGTVTGAPEPARSAFYEPPAQLEGAPGAVIRSKPAAYLLDPLGLSQSAVRAATIMYRSTAGDGTPIAVTGTVFEPTAPWIGAGPRPLISYAPGTQGIADRCAPSRQMAEALTGYEQYLLQGYLARGYAVALTDYQGLGTPGTHTYVDRIASGNAVLDLARAAITLPDSTLNATTPIGIYGYSQGGGASAAAAELAATYAPELKVKGAVAGAVPADLRATAAQLDGGPYAAFLNFALVGLSASNGIDINSYLNERGRAVARATEGQCVGDLGRSAFQRSADLTKDGRSIAEYFNEEPFASVIDNNRIGTIAPAMPVLVSHSVLDDVIPYRVGRQLAADWCKRGATVRFSTNAAPTHVGGVVPAAMESYAFFEARFAGRRAINSCG